MRKSILLLAALLYFLPLPAQNAPLEGVKRTDAIASLLKANDIRTSLQFDFVMTRHSALMAEPLVSRGNAAYVYPDRVRWEVVSPRPSLFVFNGQAVTDRRQQALLRNVSKISEKGLINEDDFRVTVYEAPGQWQVDMVPLRRDLSQLFSRITLLADSATGALRAIVLTETSGDVSEIKVSRFVKGQPVDDSLFLPPKQ